jgi:hypothetical protein
LSKDFISRRFELSDAAEVTVCFQRPVPDEHDFRCSYEIVWPDRLQASKAFGVDPVQALLLAMQKVHIQLLTSSESRAGRLRYLGERDLGLPLPSSVSAEDFKTDDSPT